MWQLNLFSRTRVKDGLVIKFGRGGGGGGEGNIGVIMVRVCESVFHILDRPKCWPIHILLFDFYTHLLLVIRQISQSIH